VHVEVHTPGASVTGDFVACWGWRVGRQYAGKLPVLVFERGYVGDRFAWTSAGWNGLNGRARFPAVDDGGERWRLHFGELERPWRYPGGGEYALLVGQVRGDSSIAHVDIERWYREAAAALARFNLPVLFRPHPVEIHRNCASRVDGVPNLHGSLADALAQAAVAATFNSNVGVDAAVAGVPVITCDDGAMARPVSAQGLQAALGAPDRSAWLARLAWCQWSYEELTSGAAWDFLKDIDGCNRISD
jgi:hypothetical protein